LKKCVEVKLCTTNIFYFYQNVELIQEQWKNWYSINCKSN